MSSYSELPGINLGPPDADGLYDVQVVLDAYRSVDMREIVNEAIAQLTLSIGVERAREYVLDLQARVEAMMTAMSPGRVSRRQIIGVQFLVTEWAGTNQDLMAASQKHWEEHPEDKARFLNAEEPSAGPSLPRNAPRPLTRVIRMRSAHHDDPS